MAQNIREKARIRQNRDDDRPTEDDIAQQRLGPGGPTAAPDTGKLTKEGKDEQRHPSPIDPGHTA
jgi:hypothetical protein